MPSSIKHWSDDEIREEVAKAFSKDHVPDALLCFVLANIQRMTIALEKTATAMTDINVRLQELEKNNETAH